MRTLLRSSIMAVAILAVSLAAAGSAHAIIHNFSMTFDGVNASIDPTSDPIIGAQFFVGDRFVLDIHAEGDDFWHIDQQLISSIPILFNVQPIVFRTGDYTTDFRLNGNLGR